MYILKMENGFIVPVKYVKAEDLYGIENIDYLDNKNFYMNQIKDNDVEEYADLKYTNSSCKKINMEENKVLSYGNCNNCKMNCSLQKNKEELAVKFTERAIEDVKSGKKQKINAIWLEISGCFGQIISLLDAKDPDVLYLLKEFVNLNYFGSICGDSGETAYERILQTLNTDYVFVVCGAVPLKDNGLYTTIATYKGRKITAMEGVKTIAQNAKYIVTVGTCSSYGGPTAARPNLSDAVSVKEFLKRDDIIAIPGCPANPVWIMGILGYLTSYGAPELDSDGRPTAYYGQTIHDNCLRRRFFDAGIFAKKLGDEECMFKLGCQGPVTYAYCPISKWNGTENWPVRDNTNCIGCAGPKFPDGNEPFVRYGGV
ncbi:MULTISPECIES: hydrogenase small subunit [Clostridium]|uniref:Hydrogenase small subunit n=2 Tax=Clostridium aquiflavi TaxID=3073603 RepID=A0ABU1EJB9_9CLOT|nr:MULTISPECIES: hydrogenase small subunit [unclassified Clostridium]MDR5588495.1 hydrogenase small subunit [Clostridium sp. 5N-1]